MPVLIDKVLIVAESDCVSKDNIDVPLDENVIPLPLIELLLDDAPGIVKLELNDGRGVGLAVTVGVGDGGTACPAGLHITVNISSAILHASFDETCSRTDTFSSR